MDVGRVRCDVIVHVPSQLSWQCSDSSLITLHTLIMILRNLYVHKRTRAVVHRKWKSKFKKYCVDWQSTYSTMSLLYLIEVGSFRVGFKEDNETVSSTYLSKVGT